MTQFVENLKYNLKQKEWLGRVSGIAPNNSVELGIFANNADEDISDKLEMILKTFEESYNHLMKDLFVHMYNNWEKPKWEKSLAEIENMYYLSGVSLKEDNSYWIVLEPNFEVPVNFNFFPRFTIVGNKKVWSNFV